MWVELATTVINKGCQKKNDDIIFTSHSFVANFYTKMHTSPVLGKASVFQSTTCARQG